ncbi:MAG: hypothetical protein ACOYEV_03815 [Candidatus Nanopelagicales bacterium]
MSAVGKYRLRLEAGLLGLLLGLAVVWPWTRGGYLLLLDWVSGPNQNLTGGVYGLSSSALDAMPFRVGTALLRGWLGADVTAWLIVLAFFPIAASGIAAAAGGPRLRAYPAVALFCLNPFVLDRLRAGHVTVLLGVAALPWLFTLARDAKAANRLLAVRPALTFALAVSVSAHAAWLGGAVLAAVALLPSPTRRDLARTLFIVAGGAAVYAYAIVLFAVGTQTLAVTSADLSAFGTQSLPGGLLVTALSLRGFWRNTADAPLDLLGPVLGGALLAAMLVMVGAGLARLWRREPRTGMPLTALTVGGLLAGTGMSGPIAPLYQWAFDHLPLFEAMREQAKWFALTLLGYSVGFGVGVQWLGELALARAPAASPRPEGTATFQFTPRLGVLLASLIGALPLMLLPVYVNGLGGSIRTSAYPAGWWAADQKMGAGDGVVMLLPWHAYQPFAFTDGRTIATPAGAFFRRPVLISDAVELPALRTDSSSRRTAYVDRIMAAGGSTGFGSLVAPLGVEYVVLSRQTAPRTAASTPDEYSWLPRSRDLTPVLDHPDIQVYRVKVGGVGRVRTARVASVPAAIKLADQGALGSEAVLAAAAPEAMGGRSADSGGLERVAPTAWAVAAGRPGWVVIPEEYSPGWKTASGTAGVATAAGTIALHLDAAATTVTYAPWRVIRVGLITSGLSLLALLVTGICEHLTRLRRRWRARSAPRGPASAPGDPTTF